jgi:hypothetical protein
MRTSEFLEDVKRHISVPTYQPRFTDDDILKLASSEQKSSICSEITSLREEFFVVNEFVTFPSATGKVQIPERAIGRTIRDIWLSTTNSTDETDYYSIIKIDLEEIRQYKNSIISEGPYAWYLQNDYVHVFPKISSDCYGLLKYSQRPSEIVLESRTATVVSYTDDTVTVDEVPDNIEVGSKCDITKVEAGFEIIIKDAVVSNVSATTITFTGYDATNPLSGFSAGDIVSLKRETSVIQLPEDWHDCLIWATCKAISYALGVPEFIEQSEKQYAGCVQEARNLCSPRAEASRPKVVNSRGILRSHNYARKFPAVTV